MLRNLLIVLALFCGMTVARGQGPVADRPDHVILATIETTPARAEIWTLSTNGAGVLVGKTPYVAPVDLRWGSGWMLKKWSKLSVWTVGDLCRADYEPTQQVWTLTMRFEVRAPGYETQQVEEELASFGKPVELDWDHIEGIPSRATISATLTPLAQAKEGAAPPPRGPATVMVAGGPNGKSGQFGAVNLDASVPEAEVIVDGAPAGRTPVRLILREGRHDVTVQKAGCRAKQQQINVSPDSEVRLTVVLDPATP